MKNLDHRWAIHRTRRARCWRSGHGADLRWHCAVLHRVSRVIQGLHRQGAGCAPDRYVYGVHAQHSTVLGKFTTKYIRVDATTTIVLDPGSQTQRLRLAGPGLVERGASNDTQELSHYDRDGRCLMKAAEGPGLGKGNDGWARKFTYSGEGDLLRRDDNLRGTTAYQHDEAHRLAAVRLPDGSQQRYAYDRAGNLVQAPGLVARIQRGNRLLEVNADQCFYDDRDHLSRREGPDGTTKYTYDSRDLLVGIESPGLSYQAVHDGLGRRTKKTVNGQTWHYYWDTDRLAAEVFPDGRLRVYVYPDAFALVPMLFLDYDSVDADPATGKRYHLYTDHLGCPELVLDDAGKTVWRARIDPYGTAHVDIGTDFHQPLRWPGHYFDTETGLHDNRFRTYSPELGRYLQSDPSGTEGGLNLYAYTDNPLRGVDLRGLADSCPEGTPGCPFKNENGPDAEKPLPRRVSPRELRIAASNRTDRKAQRARRKVVTEFLKQHGQEWDQEQGKYVRPNAEQINDQLKGHDMTKPIVVGPPPQIADKQYQYQHPDGHQGSYYTDKEVTPPEVGTLDVANQKAGDPVVPKVQKEYGVKDPDGSPPYLQSTAAPTDDSWSVKGEPPQPTPGGAVQRVVPDRGALKEVPN